MFLDLDKWTSFGVCLTLFAMLGAAASNMTYNFYVVDVEEGSVHMGVWGYCSSGDGNQGKCFEYQNKEANVTGMPEDTHWTYGPQICMCVGILLIIIGFFVPFFKAVTNMISTAMCWFGGFLIAVGSAIFAVNATNDWDRQGTLHYSFGLAIFASLLSFAGGVAITIPNVTKDSRREVRRELGSSDAGLSDSQEYTSQRSTVSRGVRLTPVPSSRERRADAEVERRRSTAETTVVGRPSRSSIEEYTEL